MEGYGNMKRVFMTLLLCYICAFVLMVTSICTSSWYTTHPLAPTEETSYGSLGLIEHCSTTNGVCTERTDILKFTDGFWPYRPLKNKGERFYDPIHSDLIYMVEKLSNI